MSGDSIKEVRTRNSEQKALYAIITSAVLRLRDHELLGPRVVRRWLPAGTWVEALRMSRLIDPMLELNAHNFNKAMSNRYCPWREAMRYFDDSNTTGVFQVTYRKTLYYYVTESGEQVSYPSPLNNDWKARVEAAGAQALIIPVTRSRPPPPQPEGGAPDTDSTTETHTPETDTQLPARKRARISAISVLNEIYWEQTEARMLFCPRDDDNTVRETLMRRIVRLRLVNSSNEGWREVIVGHDCDNDCSMNDIFEIRQRCLFLCRAYIIALETMTSGTSWGKCCSEACERLNAVGATLATNYRVVQQYNIIFRSNEMFLHPNASQKVIWAPTAQRFLSATISQWYSLTAMMALFGCRQNYA
jgi:hypothetical protein